MSLRVTVIAACTLLACAFSNAAGAAGSPAGCVSLKARYQSGFNALVSEVRAKSPLLLMQYASSLGGAHASKVPSRAAAMRALASVRPSCMRSLGTESCGRLLASAAGFINRTSQLNARFEAKHCPGSLAD